MTTVTTETTTAAGSTPAAILVPPTQVTVVPPRTLDKSDDRKSWALFFLAGGGMVMTIYAFVVLYLVQAVPRYSYHLGLFAMLNIFMIFTGIAGMLVKRTLNVSKGGIVYEDKHGSTDQQS